MYPAVAAIAVVLIVLLEASGGFFAGLLELIIRSIQSVDQEFSADAVH